MRVVIAAMLATAPAFALELTEEQVQVLTRDLRDPLSAQFRNVRKSERHDFVICGEMNAKNAYGGYVGFRKFWLVTDHLEAGFEPNLEWVLHSQNMGCGGP